MTSSRAPVGARLTGLDRRLLLKLLGAGAGAVAFSGTAMSRNTAVSWSGAPMAAGGALQKQLADYVTAARFEDLSPAVIEKAKEHIVYFFGRAFASMPTPRARRSLELARQVGGAGAAASVIGDRLRLEPADAALVNASLFSEPLPLDALLNEAVHPAVMTLPAALAVGELTHASGRELLPALAVGYEIFGKLRRAAPATCRATSIAAGYAATAAAGRLFGLDRDSMIEAFGHAAEPCFDIGQDVLPELYPGLVSRNGILAADLARGGTIEDARRSSHEPRASRSPLSGTAELPDSVEDLGYWEILTTLQRPYRSAGHESPAVELLMDLMQAHRLTRQSVAAIHVVLPLSESRARDLAVAARGPFEPACRACSSVPYQLARVLADGRIDTARLADDRLAGDSAVSRLMRGVEVTFEDGHEARWARITVRTRDGRTLARESNFFTYELPPDMWHGWLRSSGKHLLPASRLLELVQMIRDLEKVDDVAKLLAAAAPAHAGTHA